MRTSSRLLVGVAIALVLQVGASAAPRTLTQQFVPGTKQLIYIADQWVTQQGLLAATAYPLDANGPHAPVIALGGRNTGIQTESAGIAVAADGTLALDADGESANVVNVFAPGATGNVAPSATLVCPEMGEPLFLAYDVSRALYVMNFNLPRSGLTTSIFVFPSGSNGCPNDKHVIEGTRTQLGRGDPAAIAVSGSDIYAVVNNTHPLPAILEFPITANGNEAPRRIISGPKTTIHIPGGIAVNRQGEIVVVDNYAGAIYIFSPDAHGNAAPARVIAGPMTGLFKPSGVAVSRDGRIFVVNDSGNSQMGGDTITVYAADASGDALPIAVIPGGNKYRRSMIGNPDAIALLE